jgi:hypothetical protein
MDWIYLALDWDEWQALANAVPTLRFYQMQCISQPAYKLVAFQEDPPPRREGVSE